MDDQGPLVSVIVPNYRHVAFLPERLSSILEQTVKDIEVILLDDASDDGSVEVLRACAANDARVKHVIVNATNSGSPFKQWRKGLELARGTWVWIAESDDRCAPELLERLLGFNTAQGGDLGLVYAQSDMVDEDSRSMGSWITHTACFDPDPFQQDFVLDGREFVNRLLKVRNVIPNASAVLFKRELVHDASLWNDVEGMRMCGDWLFWVRLVQRCRVGFVSESLNHFRTHAAVSRAHNSTEKRITRLREESEVRRALSKVKGLDQRKEEHILYRDWSRLFPLRAWPHKVFDAVRLPGRSRASFLFWTLRTRIFGA